MVPLDPRIDRRLLADLAVAEGCRLTAYKDTLGFWTIGYGRKLPTPMAGQSWEGFTISQDVADRYLQEDILKTFPFCERLPEWPNMDTDCRKNALREMVFNIRGHWYTFERTRAAMQAKPPNWQVVHDEILSSEWAKEVGDDRSHRLARYFLSGQYT